MLMSEKILVYGNEFSAKVPPVRNLLKRAGVPYDYVSTTFNRGARQRVKEINQGKASLPILVFPDGSTLTDPALDVLSARLQSMGHTIAPETFLDGILLTLQSPRILTFGMIFLAIGVTFKAPALTFAGAVLLALAILGWVLGLIKK